MKDIKLSDDFVAQLSDVIIDFAKKEVKKIIKDLLLRTDYNDIKTTIENLNVYPNRLSEEDLRMLIEVYGNLRIIMAGVNDDILSQAIDNQRKRISTIIGKHKKDWLS